MKLKSEKLTRQEFQCPCCQEWFAVGVARLPKPSQVIEANRDKVKELFQEPVARKDVENGHEIYDGNEDQRFRTRAEVQSQLELHDKRFPKRESARRKWR
jgi:hypothetical protein